MRWDSFVLLPFVVQTAWLTSMGAQDPQTEGEEEEAQTGPEVVRIPRLVTLHADMFGESPLHVAFEACTVFLIALVGCAIGVLQPLHDGAGHDRGVAALPRHALLLRRRTEGTEKGRHFIRASFKGERA